MKDDEKKAIPKIAIKKSKQIREIKVQIEKWEKVQKEKENFC